jgi:hypothetical protein
MSFLSLVFSSRKLEKRTEQILPGSEGGRVEDRGREMAQTVYIHMNK